MKIIKSIRAITLGSFVLGVILLAQHSISEEIATLRKGTPLAEVNADPSALQNASNKDIKRERAYPMQPPSIPHKVDNYQVDLKANKCLSCHARKQAAEAQAPMISVTHYMDRDGNFLADVSPRRYFCMQCHVTQVEKPALTENTFKDVDHLIKKEVKEH